MKIVTKIIEKLEKKAMPGIGAAFPSVIQTRKSSDSTVKLLLELADGCRIEAVIITFHRRHTVCLSTQVGCAMGCRFCRTGRLGLTRSLTAAEIVAQYLTCYQWIINDKQIRHIPKPNIVLMGEGEPLHNFDNIRKSLEIFLSRDGICLGPRQITLSTVGYLPGLTRIAELPSINIALSLHSAIPSKREELIPLEKTSGLGDIIPILQAIPLKNNQYINFEYLLIAGFNNFTEDAEALHELTGRFKAIVNIIPYNTIDGLDWRSPLDEEINAFRDMLVDRDIRTMVRVSKGRDIEAACGQLKGSII
ncbi:MAG: 23S rRNA (adenine(2503)-C(2))-methyltransferase RlmN [Spirochaetae bacterium HGW-Spirochaetae-1]|jgi:23S rRNA (adenine2503-C2)-methyltransferase|nr:MAG: 23S rRNA (adenine(2503)-C(2))-methyltransferase RlmN [Spirochaetae bacterium HGW-Spirochaetae-1]